MQQLRISSTGPATGISAPRPARDAAEAALVEHYAALVRLAHLVLPPALGRQRRVLTAHAVVQRALPRGRPERPAARAVPAPRAPREEAHAWLRARVVARALATRAVRPAALALPRVTGLRIFPRAGGGDELALDRALAALDPPTRAALALTALEGLGPETTAALLAGAGVSDPAAALAAAERLRSTVPGDLAALLRGPEFDPCTVHLRPTDLLRRRRRGRIAVLAAALLLAAVPAAAALRPEPAPPPPAPPAPAADPAALHRTDPGRWADTSRVDFTAWPARGARTGDTALLGRALAAWTGGAATRTTPGTAGTAPSAPPALLYAGETGGTAVVLLHDGLRLARYTEPPAGTPALTLARADDADVTTAAAVVLARTAAGTRYLLAPWIADAEVRDLAAPAAPSRDLPVGPDGVTAPVPAASSAHSGTGGTAGCAGTTVLRLRSSARIVEDHAFLLADLGGLSPAHLTWTPLPAAGVPSRQPREATGPLGLAAWARSGCLLGPLRDSGVRSVNRWEFADQRLPEGAGRALWVCARAETWEGTGRADVTLETPSRVPGPARAVASVPDTAACGRFGQHVLAGSPWTAPSGARYLLAAGSRHVTGITAGGAVRARAEGRVLAVRTGGPGAVVLDGRLADGGTVDGWTPAAG
ncbi:hypothetical protein [Streptomyces omiyaensis]|uniref:DNA-directed RNA polymerase specialized sigma24 family protein n=1 Tax=Streptomyces omiyaensis TaxID=68247 RepID=A0ABW7BN88_9ACTN|nr:hypothetical protein [Streptomyces omiyaensis]GGY70192.1 hypothetical protein GCM10010363_59150 [Streptomyces omiyaensis]